MTVVNQGGSFITGGSLIAIKVDFPPRDGQAGYPGSSASHEIPSGFVFSQGLQYEHFFDIPAEAFRPDLHFTITVDATNAVDESDETNNSVNGLCVG